MCKCVSDDEKYEVSDRFRHFRFNRQMGLLDPPVVVCEVESIVLQWCVWDLELHGGVQLGSGTVKGPRLVSVGTNVEYRTKTSLCALRRSDDRDMKMSQLRSTRHHSSWEMRKEVRQ